MMVPTREQEFLYGITKESLQKLFEEQVLGPIRKLTQKDIEKTISKHELKHLEPDERFQVYLIKKLELLVQRVSEFNQQYHPNDTQLYGWMNQTRSRLLTELFMLDRPATLIEARNSKMKKGSSMGELLELLTEKKIGFSYNWTWNYPNEPKFFARADTRLVYQSQDSIRSLDIQPHLIKDAKKDLVIFYAKGVRVNIPLLETLDLLAILNRQDTINLINQYCRSWWNTIAVDDLRRALHGEQSVSRLFGLIGQKIKAIFRGEKPKNKRKNEEISVDDLPPAIQELVNLVKQGAIPMDAIFRLIDQASGSIEFDDGEADFSRLGNTDTNHDEHPLTDFLSLSDDQSDHVV